MRKFYYQNEIVVIDEAGGWQYWSDNGQRLCVCLPTNEAEMFLRMISQYGTELPASS